jgi:hypothetical protein
MDAGYATQQFQVFVNPVEKIIPETGFLLFIKPITFG